MDEWINGRMNEWAGARPKGKLHPAGCEQWWGVGHPQVCGLEPDNSGLKNLHPVPALGGVFARLLLPQRN